MPMGFSTLLKLKAANAAATEKKKLKLASLLESMIDLQLYNLDRFDWEVLASMCEGRKTRVKWGDYELCDIVDKQVEDAFEQDLDGAEVNDYNGGIDGIWYNFHTKQLGVTFEFKVDYTATYIHGEDEHEERDKKWVNHSVVIDKDGTTKEGDIEDDDNLVDMKPFCKAVYAKMYPIIE